MTIRFIGSALALLAFFCVAGNFAAFGQTGSCNPVSFNLAPTYQIGRNTNQYTSGDFNSDGKLDVAAINVEFRTISVISGDGAGGFGPPRSFPTVINPWSVTSADFNNDGKIDVITASYTENKFALLLNDGAGGFAAPVIIVPPNEFPNQGEYYDLQSADFNGDGNADLAVVQLQSNQRLKIFLGNGQGGFTLVATM